MNTADISVLSDELVVTLNPLRRGAHRVRSACVNVYTRAAGLAMPWTTAASDAQPRHRARTGTTPARWPFPPTPVEEGTLSDPAASAPAAPIAPRQPLPMPLPLAATGRERSLGNATVEPVTSQVTMKVMVVDVLMVLSWGAIIPGLMWLGAAAGF